MAIANSLPEQRKGGTSSGTPPPAMVFTTDVRDSMTLSLLPGAAWMCSVLIPSMPGAEPRGNFLAAFLTSSWVKDSWGRSVVGAGSAGPGAAAGCLACRASLLALVSGAMPAEERAWHALAYCPSCASCVACSTFLSC